MSKAETRTIEVIRRRDPRWQRYGFAEELKKWLGYPRKHECGEDYCSPDCDGYEYMSWETPNLLPDLYRFEADTVYVLEIEDTFPLRAAKLRDYGELAFDLDCEERVMILVRTGPNGVRMHEVSGIDLYYEHVSGPIINKAQAESLPSPPPLRKHKPGRVNRTMADVERASMRNVKPVRP